MTKTEVTLTLSDGVYVPSMDAVNVVAGNAVSFATTDGSTAYAYFSPDAMSVLSPKPAGPLAIAPGQAAELTFSSSKTGAYSAFFGTDRKGPPGAFPAGSSSVLRLEIASPSDAPPFSGPSDTMTTGH